VPLLCEFAWESGYGRVKCVNKSGHRGRHETTGKSWVTVGHEHGVEGVWEKREPEGGTEMALKPPPEDDWFAEAGREVSETARARAIRADAETIARATDRRKQIQAERELLAAAAKESERIRARATPAAAASAAAGYGITPSGRRSISTFPTASRTTKGRKSEPDNSDSPNPFAAYNPENALLAITAVVRRAADPNDPDAVLKAAGQWITKITNAITQVVKDADNERDE
jgi:hypothetical protein